MCAACLLKHYGILRLCSLPLLSEPPLSGDTAKGLQVPLMGGLQKQPCPLPPALSSCVSCHGTRQDMARRTRAVVPWWLPSHFGAPEATRAHKTVPQDSRKQTIFSGSVKDVKKKGHFLAHKKPCSMFQPLHQYFCWLGGPLGWETPWLLQCWVIFCIRSVTG